MVRQTVTLAVLFADIAKSTQLYENLGDRVAQDFVATILSRLSNTAEKHQGTVVKTIGDAVMCVFDNADKAVETAKAMHADVEQNFSGDPGLPLVNIHIGIHIGPVIKENQDVFGDAVNVASRMVDLAKPRQTLTTQETVQAMTPGSGGSVECIDKTTIKGRSGEINIYELFWEQHDLTMIMDATPITPVIQFSLELKLGDHVVNVDQSRPSVTIGRQKHNDIMLDDNRVSRSHAKVEYRRGRYVLIDQSSNGTYVLASGGKVVRLNKDELPLIGEGIIALGRPPDPKSSKIIHYIIKS